MTVRDFTAARDEHDGTPLVFSLAGQEFTCRRKLAAGHLLDISAAGATPAAISAFLRAAMHGESWERFHDLMYDPDALGPEQPLDPDLLEDICTWIVEELTARPTRPPSGSARGRSKSGRPSKATSRARSG